MPQADGSVIIDTSLNTKALEKELHKLRKKLADLEGGKVKKNSTFAQMNEEAKDLAAKLDDANGKLRDMRNARKGTFSRDEIKDQAKEVSLLQSAYNQAAGGADRLRQKISDMSTESAELQSQISGLEEQLSAATAEAERLDRELEETEAKARKQQAIADKLSRLRASLSNIVSAAVQAKTVLVGGVLKVGQKAAGGLAKGLKGIVSRLKDMTKRTKKTSGAMGGLIDRIKNLALAAVVFNQIRRAFRSMATFLGNSFKTNNAYVSSLSQIKGGLLTAFQPIFEFVLPAINAFVAALSRVVATVSAFTSSIFGKTAKDSQAAAEALYNQTEAMEGAGTAAKKASKQLASFDDINQQSGDTPGGFGTDAETIPSFDYDYTALDDLMEKLRNVEDFAFNLGGVLAEKLNSAMDGIEWGKIRSGAKGIAENLTGFLNGFVEKSDWRLIGKTIGNGISTAVDFAYTFLTTFNWRKFGTSIADGINSIIKTVDWYHLGETVGAYFDAIIETALGFVQRFDWSAAGKALGTSAQGMFDFIEWESLAILFADGWNGIITFLHDAIESFDWVGAATRLANSLSLMIKRVDWAAMGDLLSDAIKNALAFLRTAISEFDWYALGQSIKEFLVSIDWIGIAREVSATVGAAVGAFFRLVWGFIEDAWDNLVEWWHEVAFEDGKFTFLGLLEGIWEAVKGIGRWIREHIFQPFIDGFKEAFGINSPSTVMAEMGGFLIDGLKNGLSGLWDSIKGIFSDAIEGIKGFFSIDNLKEIGSNAVSGLMNGLKSIGSKVKEWGSGILGSIKDALGIHSPSKETEDVGEYTVQGYIVGLNAYSSKLDAALDGFAGRVMGLFTDLAESLLDLQRKAQRSADISLQDWMRGVAAAFDTFYANTLDKARQWANNLQSVFSRMVASAHAAAREISDSASAGSTTNSISAFSAQSYAQDIPRLASGAVIPPNREFMAVLGDQKRGNNIEAPEALIRQIVREEGGGTSEALLREILEAIRSGHVIEMDGQTVAQVQAPYQERNSARIGTRISNRRLPVNG